MITLITGVPGAGKSLFAVSEVLELASSGRHVYTNIAGLRSDNSEIAARLHEAPLDWRDTPAGSVVVYDEAQEPGLYPATAQRGRTDDERLTALETHRHTGHDIYFITQSPMLVHHHIRRLVGRHVHVYRGSGSRIVGKYEWSHCVESPNDRGEQSRADFQPWRFPSHLFGSYNSASLHTHKVRIPKKIVAMGVFVIALIFAGVHFWSQGSLSSRAVDELLGQVGGGVSADTALPPPSQSSSWDWLDSAARVRGVSGCISSASRGCRCFDAAYQMLDLPAAQCAALILGPLPRSLSPVDRSASTRSNKNA